eukprot:12433234-Ditylum_brightwellii.AAC.1
MLYKLYIRTTKRIVRVPNATDILSTSLLGEERNKRLQLVMNGHPLKVATVMATTKLPRYELPKKGTQAYALIL